MQLIIMITIMTFLFFLISFSTQKPFLKEKFSPFECGFDPFSMSRLPFSLRFYMITIIFLIFDIEIIILLPLLIITNMPHSSYPVAFLTIIFIIFISLMYEWKKE